MKFSELLWQSVQPIYQQIIAHPFNLELANGSLEKRRFLFYLEQDSLYLIGFAKALALIAGRFSTTNRIQTFLNFSLGALVAERTLHASFLYDIHKMVEPSPSCKAYIHYLIAAASTASLEEAVAAVLPCFWIYREVGRHIARHCDLNNPYIKWIETYSCKGFSDITDLAIHILDEVSSPCSTEMHQSMKKAFEYSALYEWHFWNDAYQMSSFEEKILKN